jgi:hypothetical protein
MGDAPKEKIRTAIWVEKDLLEQCDINLKAANCRSRNDYINRALEFYTGFVSGSNNSDFLAKAVAETIRGIVKSTEERIARMQFKEAVELAKIVRMIAPLCEVDGEELKKLHINCVDEVKRINGVVKLDDAIRDGL